MLEEQAGSPESCAIAKLPDPEDNPKTPDLKIAKVCNNLETIVDTGGQNVGCRITVTNNGAAAAVGPISINDVTTLIGGGAGPVMIQSVSPDAPVADWSCSAVPAANLNCSIDGSKVGPGVSRHFDLTFQYASGQQRYKNCAEGLVSGGGDVHTFGTACVEGGADVPAGPPAGNDPGDISVDQNR